MTKICQAEAKRLLSSRYELVVHNQVFYGEQFFYDGVEAIRNFDQAQADGIRCSLQNMCEGDCLVSTQELARLRSLAYSVRSGEQIQGLLSRLA